MTKTIQGSCQCTDTSFTITHEDSWVPPVMICHCTHCQRLSGGFCTYNISFPLTSLTWTGRDPGKYDQEGDSGTTNTKIFCTKCGSSISTLAEKKGLAIMKIPSIDRTTIGDYDITPQWEQFVPSKFACEPSNYASRAVQFPAMKDREI